MSMLQLLKDVLNTILNGMIPSKATCKRHQIHCSFSKVGSSARSTNRGAHGSSMQQAAVSDQHDMRTGVCIPSSWPQHYTPSYGVHVLKWDIGTPPTLSTVYCQESGDLSRARANMHEKSAS